MKRKICFLMDSLFSVGGVQRVTAVIAKALSGRYDVTIATFDPPDSQDTSLYGLDEATLSYRFFRYPEVSSFRRTACKVYSGLYRKLRLPWRWLLPLRQ